ncbi:MAG TPA: acyltransferase [Sphingomicrobium sp.]
MFAGAEQTKRITYLDGWRGLAIASVLVGHFGGIFPAGGYGVELFFVLSGRLMAEILFVQNTPLPQFFLRRFSRIYPALLTLVTTMLLVGLASPWEGAAALSFTMNYLSAFHIIKDGVLSHIWSVCIEEHCYALLACIAIWTARDIRSAIAVCIAVALLAMLNGVLHFLSVGKGLHAIYWRTDVRLASVFLSAGFFLLLRGRHVPSLSPVLAAGVTAPLFYFAENPMVDYTVGTTLLAFAVNTIDQAPSWVRTGLSLKPLTQLGAWSYSIYLWQQPFYLGFHGNPAGLAGVLGAALLSFYLVERPARRAINSLSGVVGHRFAPRGASTMVSDDLGADLKG